MKTSQKKKTLTSDESMAAVYEAWCRRRSKGIVRLAANARRVTSHSPHRIVTI